jgi:hypothetical protein
VLQPEGPARSPTTARAACRRKRRPSTPSGSTHVNLFGEGDHSVMLALIESYLQEER